MRVTAIQETSVMSYSQLKEEGGLGKQQSLIVSLIAKEKDMSIGEIAKATGLQKSSVSARIKELIEDEVLVISSRRCDKVSGRLVRPVKLAPVQMELGHGG